MIVLWGKPDLLFLGVWEGLHECLDGGECHVQPSHMVLAERGHANLQCKTMFSYSIPFLCFRELCQLKVTLRTCRSISMPHASPIYVQTQNQSPFHWQRQPIVLSNCPRLPQRCVQRRRKGGGEESAIKWERTCNLNGQPVHAMIQGGGQIRLLSRLNTGQ